MKPPRSARIIIPMESAEFSQWRQSMLAIARQAPSGLPTEFRQKLWLALAERYLKERAVNWELEESKLLGDTWRADDEELGAQIVSWEI